MKSIESFDASSMLKMLPDMFMNLNETDQRLALAIYQTIGQGTTVSIKKLAERLDLPLKDLKSKLRSWPGVFINKKEEVIGFWGISLVRMHHILQFEDVKVYAWCAWDALFIPELLHKKAVIKSKCPVTNENLVLAINSDGIITSDKKDIVVSFLLPEEAEMMSDVITNFCHFVYFFSSRKAGEQWVKEHKGTFLLTLEEATSLSKLKNALQFKEALYEEALIIK